MSRRKRQPSQARSLSAAPAAASVVATQAAPERRQPLPPASPLDLAALSAGAAPPPTSMAMATAHRVDADTKRYSAAERQAAKSVTYASDFNTNATDALSFVQATGWPGFQVLALLAQLPEYRTMHETLADEAVRTWGKITSTSKDEAVADTIQQLTQALDKFKVRSLIRQVTIHDQAYGGAHVLPRLKSAGSDLPPDAPLLMSPTFVAPGCLEEFVAIEPMWVTPNAYNASDPTKADFYKPTSWYMLSTVVHSSRLFSVVSRPVADMLKPAYSFRGVSISQLAMPYVDNWLRTRQSVSDTIKQFSITFLMCDMTQMLQPGAAYSLVQRAQLFNLTRDNRNLALCDKNTEEFAQINTPLSGLDSLQAQSQEQMSAVSHIPLVKLTGITPAGLNANSDGEIRVWYDYVAGYQSHNLTPLMQWILKLLQLSLFGKIDEGLSWDWHPLYELTDVELADVREKNARADLTYLEAGVISPEVVQQRLSQDPLSGYDSILADMDDLDEVQDIANQILESVSTPPPQAPDDDPDAEQPDAQAAPAGGDQPVAGR